MTTLIAACECTRIDKGAQLMRIKREFLGMPGLRLTLAQAQRLWALDHDVCECLLGALVQSQFLRRRPDGTYALNVNNW